MFDIQNYASFIGAILVFQLAPGPGTLTILNATARHGRAIGLAAVLGTLLGDFIYMLAAVLGLAAVLASYPSLLRAGQLIGVVYLCRLGWQLWRSSPAEAPVESAPVVNGWVHFRRALAVSLTNPKVIMFFMAFFPLFLKPGASPLTLAAMMVHVTALSLLYQSFLVLAGNAATRRLSKIRQVRLWGARLAGAALIGFGIKLALDNR